MANKINLGNGIISNSPGTSGTSFEVSGYGAVMPGAQFYATATPPGQLSTMGNSEIVLVTAKATDTLTVTRAQKSTTAQDVQAGWILSNGIYVEDLAEKLNAASNLSDLANAATSRTNLGLGSLATKSLVDIADINATGGTSASFLKKDGTWATPTNTTYTEITTAEIDAGTASTLRTITGRRAQYIVDKALAAVAAITDIVRRTDSSISGASWLSTTVNTATDKASTPNSVKTYVDSSIATAFQTLLPVGAKWYGGDNSANPSTYIPGMSATTWVATNVGRVPVGKAASGTFGTVGATGGAETHTLSVSEMPSHRHVNSSFAQYVNAANAGALDRTQPGSGSNQGFIDIRNTQYEGGGGAHNNLQPYQVEYIWIRTA